jgi:hypothetical protein
VGANKASMRFWEAAVFRKMLLLGILVVSMTSAQNIEKKHSDYVPDKKTAERIAEAILVGQYGEKRVGELLPLIVDGSDKRYWKVEGPIRKNDGEFGGGYAVWIDKHSGCIELVTDSMK